MKNADTGKEEIKSTSNPPIFKTDVVQFVYEKKAFVNPQTGHTYLGLVETLKDQYYSDYSFEKAREASTQLEQQQQQIFGGSVQRVFGRTDQVLGSKKPAGVFDSGQKTGRWIDQQLTALIRGNVKFFHRKYEYAPPEWKEFERDVKSWIGANICAESLEALRDSFVIQHLHPYTRAVLQFAYDNHFVPVAAQIPVAYAAFRIASAVDMVWRDARGRLYVVELKKCKDFYYDWFTGKLKEPLQAFRNSVRNQHQLQLCMTFLMFNETYAKHKADGAFILQVDSDKVRRHEMNAEIYKSMK